uniref:SJCHGC06525 protein n=1 Tax=Schistosoma japonicum TaxID=6182 RepID=Q5D8Y7_SCHJA|nr:SJCHGC06525 protein [Schistosoma japonicum]
MIRRLLLLFSVYIMLNMKLIKTQSNNHNKTNNVAIVTVVNVNDNDDDNVNDEYETFITLTKNTIHTRNRYSNELIEEEEQFEEIEESIVMPDYHSIENDSLNITRNSSNVNNTNSSSLSSPTSSVLSQLQSELNKKQMKNHRRLFRKHSSSINMGFSGSYFMHSHSNSLYLLNIFYNLFSLLCVTCYLIIL